MNPNINSLSNINNNQPPAQSAIAAYATQAKETVIHLPLFVKVLPIIIIILYIFSLFFWQISFYMSNLPLYTIYHIQLWRFFTATLIMTSIFNILFALLFWMPTAIGIEKTMGTLRYVFHFAINSIIIQVIYASVMLLLMLIFGDDMLEVNMGKGSKYVHCNGIWPLLMMDITSLCLQYPQNSLGLFCFPCRFKAIFYPFMLLLLFTLLNGFQIDFIVGVGYGLIYHYVLKNRIQLSDNFIAKCEASSVFRCIKGIKGYIALSMIVKIELGIGYQEENNQQSQPNANNNQSQIQVQPQPQAQVQSQGAFNPFSGQGTVVG